MAEDYRAHARAAAQRNGVDPDLFERLVGQESRFNPNAVSPAGAIGLGQLMPDTAKELGVDPKDPLQNLEGSARYLKQQLTRFGGDYQKATAAYNAGAGNVEKYGGTPPFAETQDYVARVAGGGYKANGRTVADLGRIARKMIQAKYPDYAQKIANVPDDVLGRRFRQKFPAYSGFTDSTEAAATPTDSASTAPVAAATHAPIPIPRGVPGAQAAQAATTAAATGAVRPVSPAEPLSPEEAARQAADNAAFEKARYEALGPVQRATLQFGSAGMRAMPGEGTTPEPERFPGPSGLGEEAAALAGGFTGFSAVALPVTALTSGLGAAPVVAGAVGAGLAAAAPPGTLKERAVRGGTMAAASAGLEIGVGALGLAVSKNLASRAPALAKALEREYQLSLAKGISPDAAKVMLNRKIDEAAASAIQKATLIQRGVGAVGGAAAFGVGQPAAERALLGEPQGKPQDMLKAGLELLALNLFLGGHGGGGGEAAAEAIRTGARPAVVPRPAPAEPGRPYQSGMVKPVGPEGPRAPIPITTAKPEEPGLPPAIIKPKTTLPEGPILTPEQTAAVRAEAQKRAAAESERRRIAEIEAGRKGGVEPTKRTQEVAKAIGALEIQIAEFPGDKRVNRWKRRLEKLKAVADLGNVTLRDLTERIKTAKTDAEKKMLNEELSNRQVGTSPSSDAYPVDVTKASSWTAHLKTARKLAKDNPKDIAAQDTAFRAEENFKAWKKVNSILERRAPSGKMGEGPTPAEVAGVARSLSRAGQYGPLEKALVERMMKALGPEGKDVPLGEEPAAPKKRAAAPAGPAREVVPNMKFSDHAGARHVAVGLARSEPGSDPRVVKVPGGFGIEINARKSGRGEQPPSVEEGPPTSAGEAPRPAPVSERRTEQRRYGGGATSFGQERGPEVERRVERGRRITDKEAQDAATEGKRRLAEIASTKGYKALLELYRKYNRRDPNTTDGKKIRDEMNKEAASLVKGAEQAIEGGRPEAAGAEKPSEGTVTREPKPKPKPKPKPAPSPTEPGPIVRSEAGKVERGDRVKRTSRYEKGKTGFVVEVLPNDRFTIRWEDGRESGESGSDFVVRPGFPRATEAEMKRIEAEEAVGSQVSYQPGVKPPVKGPRADVEREIAASLRARAGLTPIEDVTYKPTKGFFAEDSMMNDEVVTDGKTLFYREAMEPKTLERLVGIVSKSKRTIPPAETIKTFLAKVVKAAKVPLELRGVGSVEGFNLGDLDVAIFHDPKTGQIAAVNPQMLKLAIKAVSPDSYSQEKGNSLGAIVLRRDGKVVGLVMPLRVKGEGEAEIRGVLGTPPPEPETHALSMGTPARAPKAAKAAPAAPVSRGIPIARTAPTFPTKAEAKTLPETALPPQTGARSAGPIGALEKVDKAMHELVAITNPVRYAIEPGKKFGTNLDILMKGKGSLKRALFRNEQVQKKVHSFWEDLSKEKILNFLVRYESGQQADPRLKVIDKAYRERTDNVFNAITPYRAIPYWDNWFPHLWKDPKKAAAFFNGRRPMEGNKRFLKKRFHEDIYAGLKAGLEPVSWNPEQWMQSAEHNARKYVMVQEMLAEFKHVGAMVFVRLGGKVPENYRRLDQNWSKIYLNPEIAVTEYFDAKIMAGLTDVARKLGIKLERKMKLKMSGELGLSYRHKPNVETKFATPLSVLAHEIGHQIDNKYGMKAIFLREPTATGKGAGEANRIRIEMKKELRALADLRFEGTPADKIDPGYLAYVRSGPEKMAVMLEALVHAPEKFKEVAPLTYKKLTAFFASKPELAPILDIKPSLLYDSSTGTVHAGGAVLGGQYYAEENLARLLDNHMSRDFITETTLGRGLMESRNSLNAINLGLSAFHATGVTLLSMMSRMGIGISELAHGNVTTGIGKIATAGWAPMIYIRDGWKFFKGAPELAAFEERLFTAGASLESKQYYKNQMFDRFVRNSRQVFAEGGTPYQKLGHASKAVAQLPFAAAESTMRLLTNYVIPQMKVGAFRDLESSQLRLQSKEIAAGKNTEANVGRIAWRDIEDRMGLINYDNEFWHQTLKSSIMVLIRAPGWSLGTVRALGGAAFADMPRFAVGAATGKAPEWTSRMSFAFSMIFTTMAAGGVYHYLHTGKAPENLEDYLHPKNGLKDRTGKDQRINFPTFMRDVEGWTHDPVKSALGRIESGEGVSSVGHGGKLAPEITLAIDLLENQSYRGPIRNVNDPYYRQAGQVIRYIVGREQPFSISQARRIAKEGGSPSQIAEQFVGITPYYPPRNKHRRFRYREPEQ